MTRYADLPKPIRSGIVIVDPQRGTPRGIIVLQFNPDSLERSLTPQGAGAEGAGDRTEALRLKGPAAETWKFTAEIDATDQMELPVPQGIQLQLAALETLLHPASTLLRRNQNLASLGTLEITPIEAPLTLFTWGRSRVLPVRLTELTITEEAFDVELNPIRASVGIGLRVLTVNDLPTGHRGAELYLAHLAQKEQLVGPAAGGNRSALGLGNAGGF
ncbi:CIS tube protein [Streptomyces syringium]|uniref:CIS tube protein n=1 Tax=Streptomyces syringium TaxID=76729 RepID=UPI0034529E5C